MPATNAFKNWLKSNPNMRLNSASAVTRVLAEGLMDFNSLHDFDKKSIQNLPTVCKESIPAIAEDQANNIAAEAPVNGANISSISVRRLIVAVQAAWYYRLIRRVMNTSNMHYDNVLVNFKVEYESYAALKDLDAPKCPLILDRDGDRKVIKWAPIFLDCLSRTFGAGGGPLAYVLREDSAVPDETEDPLGQSNYFGASGSLQDELVARIEHSGPIFKSDNKSVYLLIEEAARGTTVESTVKSFASRKDGCGAFFALKSNHAGDVKYRLIHKKRMVILHDIKWNGRSYAMERHVSNHRQAVEDISECAANIPVSVPNQSQRVEFLIDSINCQDAGLQAALSLIRNSTQLRNDFEGAANALIEVDPFKKSQSAAAKAQREAQISAIDYGAGRGATGVDLRWHPKSEFCKLTKEQQKELNTWMKTLDGKQKMSESRQKHDNNKRKTTESGSKGGNSPKQQASWKTKIKKALKTPTGLKAVYSLLAENESTLQQSNTFSLPPLQQATAPSTPPMMAPAASPGVAAQGQINSAVQFASAPSPAPSTSSSVNFHSMFPATLTRLNSILKKPGTRSS